MTSGHWFGSNCNSWAFGQICQKVLPLESLADADESLRSLDGNFFLSQFSNKKKQRQQNLQEHEPTMSELIEWLSYEVEGFRQDITKLENSTATSFLEDMLRERDSYLLTLLSIVVSLLMVICVAFIFVFYTFYKKSFYFQRMSGPFSSDVIH